MADISKIKVLDGTTYNIKDDNAVRNLKWNAVTQGQKWSRICLLTPTVTTEGSAGLLAVSCTRGSVVCNATFLITISHAGSGLGMITEIGSNNYTPVRVRLVCNTSGIGYVELYDTANSIASGTAQTWHCSFIPLLGVTVTVYTAFTDGSTIPSGYAAYNDMTTTVGDAAYAVKSITRSGTTFTATRQNGSTFTFTQQDNNTHRPIQMNGTEILGDNTTALNLKAGGNVTLTNSSGEVTIAATNSTYNFAGVQFNSGNSGTAEHNANNATANGNYYYNSTCPGTDIGASTGDGALYVQSYSGSWVGQIAQDYRNGGLFVRGKNNGTWTAWTKVFDANHKPSASYTPAGTVSTPTITVTPSTTSVGSASGWSAGSAPTYTATKGVLTMTTGSVPSLTVTSTTVATGISSASSTQPTFTGTAATITSS